MSDAHPYPPVSGLEVRVALAQRGRTRPNPLMATTEAPAWEWTTDEQAELEQLRESEAELRTEVDRLRGAAADGRAREKELRDALHVLAAVRPWQRRAVLAELTGRGLL